MSASTTVLDLGDKASALGDKGLSSSEIAQNPRSEVLAATPYGESPVAAAAANGWRATVVEDTATSKKHPARFAVLTRTIDRARRSGTGGFGTYQSVAAMGSGTGSVVIGFDTEFVGVSETDPERGWVGESTDVTRRIVSYQFAAIDPTDESKLRLVVVLPQTYDGPLGPRQARLSVERALGIAIEHLGLHEHPLAVGWGAQGAARDDVKDSEGKYRPSRWFTSKVDSRALPITLVAHLQHADLTTFVDRRKALDTWNLAYPERAREAPSRAGWSGYRGRWLDSDVPDILRAVIAASAGMVSPTPVRMVLDGANWWWARPIELSIRDTMAQSGAQPLRALGEAVGVPKQEVPDNWITRMDEYLSKHPVEFMDYAANDAVIALEYVSQVYGDHKAVPLTLPTAAARVVRESITSAIEKGRFNSVFGGLRKVDKKVDATTSVENQLDYYRKRELQPIDGSAATWIHASALAFRGGYNMSAELGLFEQETHDLDLKSCYPTSSSTIWDVDYLHPDGVIRKTVNNQQLELEDFKEGGPLTVESPIVV